jgi:integrase
MVYNEDIIRRNLFDFKPVDVVPNDSQKRIAMTAEQQELWMGFIREDKTYAKYYDEFVVLLGTSMRVSEFCGLTKSDLDFVNRRIRVDHQLVRERGRKYYVEKTKKEPLYSYDGGSFSKSEQYPCRPQESENGNRCGRI